MLLYRNNGVARVQMAAWAAGKPSQGQHKHHILPGLARTSLQIFLHWKRPTELHCSWCQPGLPAVTTHFLCIWATVDFCKRCLTLLTSHTHPSFAEPGWSGCLVSQSFISRSLEDALFLSGSRGNQRDLGVQIPRGQPPSTSVITNIFFPFHQNSGRAPAL